jgi:hypothetical protein
VDGLQGRSGLVRKIFPPTEFDPRTVLFVVMLHKSAAVRKFLLPDTILMWVSAYCTGKNTWYKQLAAPKTILVTFVSMYGRTVHSAIKAISNIAVEFSETLRIIVSKFPRTRVQFNFVI